MPTVVRVVVAGACGRMGTAVIHVLELIEGIELAGALERDGYPCLGHDPGSRSPIGEKGIPVVSEHSSLPSSFDVLIDFTDPVGTLQNAEYSADAGIPLVSGTTGLNEEQKEALVMFAKRTPVVHAPNMSVGVNLLFKLASTAASALGSTYDAEIVETHHRMKKDAPSGTAIRLAESVAQARGQNLADAARYSRHGMIGERPGSEIGIQTLRAGDIVGEHTLLLAGPGERIELTHRAHSRENFARGAVRAALWIIGKEPGLYSMADVLGIK